MSLDRRRFLTATAGLAASPWLLGAAGKSDLHVAQLVHSGMWNPRRDAMRRLLWEVDQRTSIEVHLDVAELAVKDPKLFRHPFIYWGGTGGFAQFDDATVKRLRRYLTYGGTLLIDSADAEPGGAFDVSVRRELQRILPDAGLGRIPNEHVLFKSFYLVDHQGGRILKVPYLEGVLLEERYAVIYCQNDLGGAWARDAFGRWEHPVTPGGERQRELAFRLGINIEQRVQDVTEVGQTFCAQ